MRDLEHVHWAIERAIIRWAVFTGEDVEPAYDDGLVFDGLIVDGVEYGVKIDVWERGQ